MDIAPQSVCSKFGGEVRGIPGPLAGIYDPAEVECRTGCKVLGLAAPKCRNVLVII